MAKYRPIVLSIAGLDPTAGAGLLADIKCFEQHEVYGFGICSAVTAQTDDEFFAVDWMDASQIIKQLMPLKDKFIVVACKIGLIKDPYVLEEVLKFMRSSWPDIKIVVDPILKASAGYQFREGKSYAEQFFKLLDLMDLITPNYLEMCSMSKGTDVKITAADWSVHCPVLLKGGHNDDEIGTDYLYDRSEAFRLETGVAKVSEKHGSGCVLSASITAYLALGYRLPDACLLAKSYIERFLNSNTTLLGYHYED